MAVPVTSLDYQGGELALFAHAANWKRYLAAEITPHLGDSVLEVGAGLGATTAALYRGSSRWDCLEPDPRMADDLARAVAQGTLPRQCRVVAGTTADLAAQTGGASYDCILYVDVLEHIEDDGGELARAFGLLRPGGRLVVLSPAFQWLYTAFDEAIGHVRRYDRRCLTVIAPAGATEVRMCYLDCVGMAASLANRLLLRSGMPTLGQVLTWDRWMVPLSRRIDPMVGHRFGKSILAVWRR